jgi:hypothetical protein
MKSCFPQIGPHKDTFLRWSKSLILSLPEEVLEFILNLDCHIHLESGEAGKPPLRLLAKKVL